MGLFSEIHAEATAKELEKIILKAMNDSCWCDIRSAVLGFVKEELVEWYYDKCSETWGSYNANPKIEKMFPPKDNIK